MALEGWLTEVQSISGLLGVSIEDWVVLLKNKFDVHAHNEPHIAQALFLEKASGRFLHKVFGKTIRDGRLDAPSGLPELAQDIFEHSRVCQGFDSDLKGEHWNSLAPGFHPYPRQMDPGCSFVFKDPSNTATVCPSCTQTMHCEVDQVLVEEVFEAVDHKPDIEPEEIIVTMEDLTKIDLNEVEASLWPSDDKLGKVTFSDSDKVAKDDKQDEKPIIKDGTPGLKRKRRTIKSASKSDVVETCAPNEPIQKESLNVKSGDKLPLFPCNHCNKMFRGRGGYRKHRAFLRNRSRKIPCKVCADVHYSFDSLAKHMEVEHLQVPISLTQYLQPPEEIKTMRNGQRCSTCKVYCNGLSVLTRHRALYHELGDFKCADCHQYHLTYYDLVLHNYNQHDKLAALLKPSTEDLDKVEHEDGRIELKITRYDCPKCDKSYNDDGIWGIHMKAHHSWSIFTCQECDEKCHYVKDFVDHVKNFHSDNPEIKCPKCAEIISLDASLSTLLVGTISKTMGMSIFNTVGIRRNSWDTKKNSVPDSMRNTLYTRDGFKAHFSQDQFYFNASRQVLCLRSDAVPTQFSHTKFKKARPLPRNRSMNESETEKLETAIDHDHKYGMEPENNVKQSMQADLERVPQAYKDEPGSDPEDPLHIQGMDDFEDVSEPITNEVNIAQKIEIPPSDMPSIPFVGHLVGGSDFDFEVQTMDQEKHEALLEVRSLRKTVIKLGEDLRRFKTRYRRVCREKHAEVRRKAQTNSRPKTTAWSIEMIRKGLQIRLACGESGYNTLIDLKYSLPSIRTLQRRTGSLTIMPS
eukprot:maker-scaffold136_size321413-snap-gene-2.18 protein:Tk06261 transcript:maker-scaffold136_size321413-snap-gene-2.18-mRNA-1 annotation:"zinc finger protein 302"